MYTYVYVHIHIYVYTHVYTHTDRNGEMAPFLWRTLTNTVAGNCFFFSIVYIFFFQFSSSTKLWVPQSQSQSFIFFQCLSQHLAWCWTYSRKLKGISLLLVIILFSLHCQLIFACPIFQMNIFFISLRISLWMIQAKVYKVLG